MAKRSDIINYIVDQLKLINGTTDTRVGSYTFHHNVHNKVFSEFKFMDEINERPFITFVDTSENRIHLGAGEKLGQINLGIRAYVNNYKYTLALDAADDIIEDIEHILNLISKNKNEIPNAPCLYDIQELRVNTVGTDEGLFEPDGIAEITATITYILDSNLS